MMLLRTGILEQQSNMKNLCVLDIDFDQSAWNKMHQCTRSKSAKDTVLHSVHIAGDEPASSL